QHKQRRRATERQKAPNHYHARAARNPLSETSSLADPCSPSPGASGSRSLDGSDRPGQKRFRTQMTNLQLKVLKSCFNDYRTPTMLECEVLGNDIGLPKRVVQVWFQNARAKEKKAKLNMAKHFGINQTSYEGPKTDPPRGLPTTNVCPYGPVPRVPAAALPAISAEPAGSTAAAAAAASADPATQDKPNP
uniref:Zinc finger homeobox 3 n=1 Tax=Neogobius melanostomus TaxID=47308 RepID=A0A8C6SWZ2_9GOBI